MNCTKAAKPDDYTSGFVVCGFMDSADVVGITLYAFADDWPAFAAGSFLVAIMYPEGSLQSSFNIMASLSSVNPIMLFSFVELEL